MMTKYDKERFNKRISDEVQISADIRINDFMTESATYVIITESSLYERICQYALQHGEDLQGMFKDERYEYMSCFVRDVAAFRANFESEEMLKPLFKAYENKPPARIQPKMESLLNKPGENSHDVWEEFEWGDFLLSREESLLLHTIQSERLSTDCSLFKRQPSIESALVI